MNIDPRETIYRKFWAGSSNTPIMEGQNYYNPNTAIGIQYSNKNIIKKPFLDGLAKPSIHIGPDMITPAPQMSHRMINWQPNPKPPMISYSWQSPSLFTKALNFLSGIISAIVNFVKGLFKKAPIAYNTPMYAPSQQHSQPAVQKYSSPFDTHTVIFGKTVI